MTARDIIAVALCGFDTQNDQIGAPDHLIGLTLEKARHEAACLTTALDGDDETLTAGSLEGRLQALDAFISEYMVVTWKQSKAEQTNDAERTETEPES